MLCRNTGITGRLSHVRAYRDGSVQSIPSLTFTKVQLNAESYDALEEFDTTTNSRFTAKQEGCYVFDTSIFLQGTGNGSWFEIWLLKNGTGYSDPGNTGLVYRFSPGEQSIHFGGTVLKLAAGDYVEVFVKHNSDTALNIYNHHLTFLTVNKLVE